MKILMVTPYPPVRDGIASYAVQEVARLRAEGNEVEVLSPGPSAAHHHLSLVGARGALALAKRVAHYDRVIVQFHPDVFFPVPASPNQWTIESAALALAFWRARDVEVRIHEIDYSRGSGARLRRFVNRLPWRIATRVVVHTDTERDSLSEAFGVRSDRIVVGQHGADFRPHTRLDRAEARASLGLPKAELIFLNIGFIQPHKGFDRAVKAIARMEGKNFAHGFRLDIVGSIRTADPAYVSYLEELRAMAAATQNTYLHEGYLSDELFDRWLVASDVVVLPYRLIWSSSVLERALLFDRPVIATDVGGLSFQRGDRDLVTLVDDDAELCRAMAEAVTKATGATWDDFPNEALPWVFGDSVSREAVQAEIRARAMRHRQGSAIGAPAIDGGDRRLASTGRDASAPLRKVSPAGPAPTASNLPGGGVVKRLIRRLTAWEIDPLVKQLNDLREATIKAIDR